MSSRNACLFVPLQETARRVARVSIESKIDMDEERYVDGFKPYMMDVVKAWVEGQSFASICKMTTIYEGNRIAAVRKKQRLPVGRLVSCRIDRAMHPPFGRTTPTNVLRGQGHRQSRTRSEISRR